MALYRQNGDFSHTFLEIAFKCDGLPVLRAKVSGWSSSWVQQTFIADLAGTNDGYGNTPLERMFFSPSTGKTIGNLLQFEPSPAGGKGRGRRV